MDRYGELNVALRSLALFRGLLNDPVVAALAGALAAGEKSPAERADACGRLGAALYQKGENLTEYLLGRALRDENPYSVRRGRGEAIGPAMEACLSRELAILQSASRLTAAGLHAALALPGGATWGTAQIDFERAYRGRMARLRQEGYGAFSERAMFRLEDRSFQPIGSADRVRPCDLVGYERERAAIVDNTRALIEGRPAANALLYGDAGTGKSSTVKAVANAFVDRGLRLVEIRKDQLSMLTWAMERLSGDPLKFILFIDDLSFAHAGDEVGSLKATLEGAACSRAANLLIYATSNRRHIVAQSFRDREGDVHANETMQEQTSLAERFGLQVLFARPDRDQYLAIVRRLAEERGLDAPPDLDARAERFAMSKGGRSPRAARQFIDALDCSI